MASIRSRWPLAFAVAASALIAASAKSTGDYPGQVEPAVRALVHGNVSAFLDAQPVYGSFSALVQAPFAAVAVHLGDGSDLLFYRLALFPCLLALGLLGVALCRAMAERGQLRLVCAAAAALVLVNPATFQAVENGHPEELLAGALLVGAILAGLRGRGLWAAVLLGLAVSTKQWAVLGAVPVLLACRGGNWRLLKVGLTAAAVAAVLIAPLAITNTERYTTNTQAAQGGTSNASRFSVWWPLSSAEEQRVRVGDEVSTVVRHRVSGALTAMARPTAAILAVALALLYAWRRQGGASEDGIAGRAQADGIAGRADEDLLALLALVLLVRCVLDPLNNAYYHVPVLISLLAWEGLRLRGLPALTLLSAAALWATFSHFMLVQPALDNGFYLAWTAALSGWLAVSVFWPGLPLRARRLAAARRLTAPVGRPWLPARNA
jgi:glycosyl transferase family 87